MIHFKRLYHTLWWKLMPGTTIRVKWPVSDSSADPNDHYRSFLEEHVGKQGWDWNWGLHGNDVAENMLSIKIRRKKDYIASILVLAWG